MIDWINHNRTVIKMIDDWDSLEELAVKSAWPDSVTKFAAKKPPGPEPWDKSLPKARLSGDSAILSDGVGIGNSQSTIESPSDLVSNVVGGTTLPVSSSAHRLQLVFSPNSIATDSEASGPGRAPGDGTAEKVFPAINPEERDASLRPCGW